MYTALIPKPSRRRVSPIPKLPIGERKSSIVIRRGYSRTRNVIPTLTPTPSQEQQKLGTPPQTQTLNKIFQLYQNQQEELILLKQELVKYKRDTNETLNVDLHDRFEGISSKHEIMTQYACKWFGIMIIGHLLFIYIYFFVRQSTQTGIVDDDEVSSAREQAQDGLMEVTAYSFSYLFIVIFDIVWMTIFPDKVRCERRTTDNTHVIVAAHRAHESLEVMLPTVLRTFDPQCVWVADNGFPDEETEALCDRLGVHYVYNPIPNKANALVVVARKIKRKFGDTIKNGKQKEKKTRKTYADVL